jgi:AcrR family transcriptional regulator
MNEKRKLIMDVAVTLFSAKGYHSTSIQEIVDGCDIAKGSFYNYFRSKEELLISIFRYFHETLADKLSIVENDSYLTEKEKYIKQINIQIEQVTINTDFIQMFVREQMVHISEELDQFIHFIRKDSLEWFSNKVRSLYPGLPGEYILDCALILDSMVKQYISILLFDKTSDIKGEIAPFLLNRLDSIVTGFLKHNDPLLKAIQYGGYLDRDPDTKKQLQNMVALQLDSMKSQGLAAKDRKILDALSEVQRELAAVQPKKIVLESLLLMLRNKEKLSVSYAALIEMFQEYLAQN